MNETKREKYIRFLLIAACLLVVVIGFVYAASPGELEHHEEPLVAAQVLQKQDDVKNAVAAVAKMSGDQPVLVLYEIEREDKYRFNVLHGAALEEQIEVMKIHGDGEGLWAKINKDEWILFSNDLEVLNQTEQPENGHSTRQSFHYEKSSDRAVVALSQKEIVIGLSKETKPLELHPLSADDSLWLVVYKDELVLAKSR